MCDARIPSISHTAQLDFTEISEQALSFDVLLVRQQCINVAITDDARFEDNEQFQLTLSQSSPPSTFPVVTIDPRLASVTIIDDDGETM